MRTPATERVTVLRGSETNAYGDEVDSETAVHTGVLMGIYESVKSRNYLPAEGATRTIVQFDGYAASNADIQKNDRIRSEKTGRTYLVTDVHQPTGVAMTPDLEITLSQTS